MKRTDSDPYRTAPAMGFRRLAVLAAALTIVAAGAVPALAARIKDIVDLRGVRSNQLVGYGLVVGLDGTGDKDAAFTVQSMSSMLEKMGMTVDPDKISADNVASVMVTADLPAFTRAGSRIDVLVNSIGGAKNLQGGTLLFTPLKGADGRVYAVAQGPVSTGGFAAGGSSGSSVQKNFPTVGRVVGGATIERGVETAFSHGQTIALALHRPDFTTSARVADAINRAFYEPLARSVDGGSVEVRVPEKYQTHLVAFVTRIESLGVTPDTEARVVINERTGTVVMGADVRISTIAIAHGNLSIQIRESTDVSQPLPFSQGETVATPQSDVTVSEERSPVYLMEPGVSIGEVVRALNVLGVSPRDLIAIFQAIKAAGALQAELEII